MPNKKKICTPQLWFGICAGSLITTTALAFIHFTSKIKRRLHEIDYFDLIDPNATSLNSTTFYSRTFNLSAFNFTKPHDHEKTDLGLTEQELNIAYYCGIGISLGALMTPMLYTLGKRYVNNLLDHGDQDTEEQLDSLVRGFTIAPGTSVELPELAPKAALLHPSSNA